MIDGKELRDWVVYVRKGDVVDIVSGNTLTLTRDGVVHDCLKINDFSFDAYREAILNPEEEGADPWADKAAYDKKIRVKIAGGENG